MRSVAIGPQTSDMPFGAVMATGLTAQLSATLGWPDLRVPLLVLALAQALLIPAVGRGGLARWRMLVRRPQFGAFTVPVGLLALAVGFAEEPSTLARVAAWPALALGWLCTVTLFALLAVRRPPAAPPRPADGTWFLAPAALLAGAIASAAWMPAAPSIALTAAGLGTVGYLVTVALVAARPIGGGVAALGTRLAPWWICAGCAGLAATALGRVAPLAESIAGAGMTQAVAVAVLALWIIGSALLLAILAGSAHHLWVNRGPRGLPPWPPTFSMGVYALGAGQAGALCHLPPVATISRIAAGATLAFWIYTMIPRTEAALRDLRSRRGRGRAPGRTKRPAATVPPRDNSRRDD